MSLGRNVKEENKLIRDVNADYVEANLAEYEKYIAAGDHDKATHVGNVLKKLGYEVQAPKKTAKEKAVATVTTEKAVTEAPAEKAVPADTTEKAVDAA